MCWLDGRLFAYMHNLKTQGSDSRYELKNSSSYVSYILKKNNSSNINNTG